MRRMVKADPIEALEARVAPAFSAVVDLAALDGTDGFELTGGGTGGARTGRYIVSDGGDINGDGLDDFLVGRLDYFRFNINQGHAYVVFGKTEGFGPTLNLSGLDGTNGFELFTSESNKFNRGN